MLFKYTLSILGIGYHEKAKTQDGYDSIFATNYLGHFLLTYLLVGKLIKSTTSRIVNVTSVCHRFATQGLDLTKQVSAILLLPISTD